MIGISDNINTNLVKNIGVKKSNIKDAKAAQAEKVAKEAKDAALKKACASFEGMFLEMMMQSMRKATMDSGLIKKSNGEKIFTDMLDQQYVDVSSKSPFTGIGNTLYSYIKATNPEYEDKPGGNNFTGKIPKNNDEALLNNLGAVSKTFTSLK